MLGMMLLTSKGAAGVSGSGFVALVVGIDRFMSEARALTSTACNIVSCIAVAAWEHSLDTATLQAELRAGFRPAPLTETPQAQPALVH